MSFRPAERSERNQWAYILLLIPFVATLWMPFYAKAEPSWQGIPFFYWYMFLWVIISSVITAVVYFITD